MLGRTAATEGQVTRFEAVPTGHTAAAARSAGCSNSYSGRALADSACPGSYVRRDLEADDVDA